MLAVALYCASVARDIRNQHSNCQFLCRLETERVERVAVERTNVLARHLRMRIVERPAQVIKAHVTVEKEK